MSEWSLPWPELHPDPTTDWLLKEAIMARYVQQRADAETEQEKVGGVTPENLAILKERLRGGR